MSISEADVRHVAALARLELADDRIAPLVAEMNRILDYVGILQRVEMSPQSSTLENAPLNAAPLRPDNPGTVELARPIAEFAPAERDGFLLVPRLSSHA